MEKTGQEYKEVNDNQTVGSVWFYIKTYRFFHEGLKLLLTELSRFDEVFKAFELKESPFEDEKRYIQNMIEYGEEWLSAKKDEYSEILVHGISYSSLRYLKAGGLLSVRQIEKKKQALIEAQKDIPIKVLQTIDEKIKQMKDMTEQGVLNGLKPAEIFLEIDKIRAIKQDKTTNEIKDVAVREANPIIIETEELQIIDDELRSRCLALLNVLEGSENKQNQLDTRKTLMGIDVLWIINNIFM